MTILTTATVSLINLVNEPTVAYCKFATNFCYFAVATDAVIWFSCLLAFVFPSLLGRLDI